MTEHTALSLSDLEKRVATQMIDLMKQGGTNSIKPWSFTAECRNYASNRPYSGSNNLMLGLWLHINSQSDPRFITFKQARYMGGAIAKGSKGIPILFYGSYTKKGAKPDESETRRFARITYAFHVSSLLGVEIEPLVPVQRTPAEVHQNLLEYVTNTGVKQAVGTAAYYTPSTDTITMPPIWTFLDHKVDASTRYASVLAHELVHATGQEGRAHRPHNKNYQRDDTARAREELIAEIGAAMLCQKLGITMEPTPDNVAYLHSWIALLAKDSGEIFKAASAAAKGIAWSDSMQPHAEMEQAA